ncbi:sporulation protein YpjB [Paenibacillus hexagrammi]|uniref:Sporulation protein YpjB n=1 Tax=Paenibacillus hexagrammi TaxID=2908839 RepID=A0ABY3ST25_9BACL|nr:sporulation protein YpjB [Paenibacillus sp. YPD9-1]UJF36166.1 sporulation protein YpjB [Paenibacillus sp. YPD9-1]
MFVDSGIKRVTAFLLIIIMACGISACSSVIGQDKGHASVQTDPEQAKKMDLLNEAAEDMYKKTMEGQVVEARTRLMQISDQIPKMRFEGVTSVEGLNALTETITQAKRVYNAVSYSQNEGQVAVAKLRLATDALTHKNQPMWLQYYKVLKNDVTNLEQQVKANQSNEAIASFNKLSQHISVVRPSMLISREPSDVEKLDSLMTFVHNNLNSSPMDAKRVEAGIEQLNRTIDELFMKKAETAAYVPITDPNQPILWSLGIGLIIVSVLSYSGWRMFQSGRHVVSVKHSKEREPM